jgi:hypothetical protein
MNGHGSKFGRKIEQAIAALLLHRNLEEAAKAVGISAATLKRWKQLPEFKAAHLEARKELVFQTNARMQQNCGAAAFLPRLARPLTLRKNAPYST